MSQSGMSNAQDDLAQAGKTRAAGIFGALQRMAGGLQGVIGKATSLQLAAVPLIGTVAALSGQVISELFDHSIAIHSLSVPQKLEADGFTPAVMAEKLNDALTITMIKSQTRMLREQTAVDDGNGQQASNSSSVAGTVSSVLHYLHLSGRRFVSGEVTGSDNQYTLTIRMSDDDQPAADFGPVPEAQLSGLLSQAARTILWRTQPYLIASYDYEVDPARAYDDVNSIIRFSASTDPNVPRAYNLRGLIHQNLKQYREAEVNFREAANLDPSWPDPHSNLGDLLTDERRWGEAAAEYNRALSLDRNMGEAHNGLGNILERTGKYRPAIAEYRQAIALVPARPEAYNGIGFARAKIGDLTGAMRDFETSLAMNPKYFYAHANLAWLLRTHPALMPNSQQRACQEAALAFPDPKVRAKHVPAIWVLICENSVQNGSAK